MEMREATYLILAALQGGPRHGYGIIQFAADASDGRVKLSTGTLYTALDRLAGARLIEPDHGEVVDGRARRYYRLTASGTAALLAEAARLAEMSRVVTEAVRRAGPDRAPADPPRSRPSRRSRVRPA
jgi:DNA-binding PadR family transcriptional regulator